MIKGWSFLKIKDYPIQIIDGDRGTNYPTKEEFLQDGYCLFLNTGNVTLSGFHFDEKAFVTEEKHKKLRKGHLQRYDSVLTTRGTIGNVAFYGDSIPYDVVRINSGMLILRPDQSKLDPRFFYGLLRSSIFQQQADLFRYGAAQPQLPITTLKHIRLPLPPLPIQQKVAGILSAYDDLIENNLKRIKLLEEMAQITYEEWFVRLRFPGHESTAINPETSLPKGWEIKKVGSLIGKSPKSANIKSSEIQKSGSIPVVDQSRDFVAGYTDDPESLINLNFPIIIFGDHTRVLKFINFPFARGADGTQVVISNEKRMPQHLFYHALLNLDLSNYHYARHYKFLKELEIVVPDLTLASKYELITQEQFEAIKNLRHQNRRLQEARDILLPRLMAGLIDVESYDPAQLLKEAA